MDLARSHAAAWRLGKSHFDYAGDLPSPRGLLIGEAPGPNTNPKLPLFPEPSNSAAGRLLRYADVDHVDYMGKFVRMNLCREVWSAREAYAGRVTAIAWLLDGQNWHGGRPLRVLLLGARVARAWACHGTFGSKTFVFPDTSVKLDVAWIPHPSGRCHHYNERRNQLRARRAVLWAIGERDKP